MEIVFQNDVTIIFKISETTVTVSDYLTFIVKSVCMDVHK